MRRKMRWCAMEGMFCSDSQPLLRAGLQKVEARGYALVRGFVEAEFRARWAAELASGPYRLFRDATASFDRFTIRPGLTEGFPLSLVVMREFADLVHQCGGPLFAAWRPNVASVQRYRSPGDGIRPHRDNTTDELLSAVFGVTGSAGFSIFDMIDRGQSIDEFEITPGAVVLLIGTSPVFAADPRPWHEVGGPREGERISFGARMVLQL